MACMVWDLLFAPLINASTAMQREPLWPAWFGISSLPPSSMPVLQCRGNYYGLHGLGSPLCPPHQCQYCNAEGTIVACMVWDLLFAPLINASTAMQREPLWPAWFGISSLPPSSMPVLQCRGNYCGLHGLGSPLCPPHQCQYCNAEGTIVACMVWDLLFAPLINANTAMQRELLWPAWFGISSLPPSSMPVLQCRGNHCGLHGLGSPLCPPHQCQYCNAEGTIVACMVWDLLFAPLINASTAIQREPLWPAWFGISSLPPSSASTAMQREPLWPAWFGISSLLPSSMPVLQCRGNHCGLHGLGSPLCPSHQCQYCDAEGTIVACMVWDLLFAPIINASSAMQREPLWPAWFGISSLPPSSMPVLQCRGNHCGLWPAWFGISSLPPSSMPVLQCRENHCGLHSLGSPLCPPHQCQYCNAEGTIVACMVWDLLFAPLINASTAMQRELLWPAWFEISSLPPSSMPVLQCRGNYCGLHGLGSPLFPPH